MIREVLLVFTEETDNNATPYFGTIDTYNIDYVKFRVLPSIQIYNLPGHIDGSQFAAAPTAAGRQ